MNLLNSAKEIPSWMDFDINNNGILVVYKEHNEIIDLVIQCPIIESPNYGEAGNAVIIRPQKNNGSEIWSGTDLNQVMEYSTKFDDQKSLVKIRVPKDAPGGIYEIILNRVGNYKVFSDRKTFMALSTTSNFAAKGKKIYFQVPSQGQLIVSAPTLVYKPNGELLTTTPQSGIINLPPNVRGIYSLDTEMGCNIEVKGFQTYFTTERESLFKIFYEDPINYNIPTTQLRVDYKNRTLSSNGANIFVEPVSGTLFYRYKITRVTTKEVTVFDRNTHFFNLINAGVKPVSGQEYVIEVATLRDINEGFGEYGTPYSVFTP